jgi:transcriptional regulator with XRE-family HTH domain
MKLSDYRKNRNLSQQEVADRMGVTQAFVSMIESNNNPTIKTLRSYFNAMGYTLSIEPKFEGYKSILKKKDYV